ncbi:MAG: peptidylprolyl isomerase [Marinilabiliales bacterium]|nr:MAG: peptidylprolyl isomerase [Marinilabiliales bacterium]
MNFLKLLSVIALIVVFASCTESSSDNKKSKEIDVNERNKSLEKVNKYLVRTENEDIENYIRRHNWNMTETGSGLRIEITKEGNGSFIKKGDYISLEYETRLITGDLVYSSKKDGVKSFIVGHGGVESGIEEAVLLLKKGSEANIILPSHLAFGLLGDQKRIPSRSTLIYKIKVINK